jgi:hypothetical protein
MFSFEKISGQRRIEQFRKAAIPMERIVGLWANAIRCEMKKDENELKHCLNETKCNGGVSESNEGGQNELLIPYHRVSLK